MKRLAAALAALLLSFSLSAAALAMGGVLRVHLKYADGPVSGIQVEAIQVATGDRSSAAVTEAFSAVCPSAARLTADATAAQTLYRHVLEQDLSGETALSDAAGDAVFPALEAGLYLVLERDGQALTFRPYLVWLTAAGAVSTPKTEESGNGTLTVSKRWEDGNDADGLRPASVTVTLLRNGDALRRGVLSAENGWTHTFSGLPDTGIYTIEEDAVEGYTASCVRTETGFQLTNHHQNTAPDAVSVTVRKLWEDDADAAGARPDRVTVQLIRNGEAAETAVLSEANSWTASFAGLPVDGTYSVWEHPVPGYAAAYSGNADVGFTVTNRYTGKTEPQPNAPTIPQTGPRLYAVYLLLAAGVSLTLLGLVILRRERGKP